MEACTISLLAPDNNATPGCKGRQNDTTAVHKNLFSITDHQDHLQYIHSPPELLQNW